MFMSLFFNFFILQVWQGLLKFSENYLNLELQITPFFKNKHFELCYFVMYRVRNIVNRRESDVICHSVRRSRVPTSTLYNESKHNNILPCLPRQGQQQSKTLWQFEYFPYSLAKLSVICVIDCAKWHAAFCFFLLLAIYSQKEKLKF
jgi:hypothetical protein